MGFAQLFTGFADEPRPLSGAARRKKNAVTSKTLSFTDYFLTDYFGGAVGFGTAGAGAAGRVAAAA
jgi:hypothetical protein